MVGPKGPEGPHVQVHLTSLYDAGMAPQMMSFRIERKCEAWVCVCLWDTRPFHGCHKPTQLRRHHQGCEASSAGY